MINRIKKHILLFILFILATFPLSAVHAQVRTCTDAAASAVRLSISPTTRYVGETFVLTITGDASTYILDDFGGGMSCNGGDMGWSWQFTGSGDTRVATQGMRVCSATTPGDFIWTHKWRPCRGYLNNIPQNCISTYCTAAPGNVPYTVLALNPSTSVTATPNPTLPPNVTATPSPTTGPSSYTVSYRCADYLFNATDSSLAWKDYQNADFSPEPVKFYFTFTNNVVPGADLTIFCQFKDNNGNVSQVYPKSIRYTGGDPKINSISCGYDLTGVGTTFTIKGINFGSHSDQSEGKVVIAGKEGVISYWAEDLVSIIKPVQKPKFSFSLFTEVLAQSTDSGTPTPTPTEESSPTSTITPTPTETVTQTPVPSLTESPVTQTSSPTPVIGSTNKYKIVTKLKEKLPEGKYPVTIYTDDGRIAKGYCTIGTTTIDFSAQIQCGGQTASLTQDNVTAVIKEDAEGAKDLLKKKIKLDAEGKPVDFAPSVEIGKNYILNIKAPKGLSKKIEFTAEEGTTDLGNIVMPLGDIYPALAPDNKINAFDKAEMVRQWSLVNDVTRAGDLNNDSRVNSIDYSCLLTNYNREGDL